MLSQNNPVCPQVLDLSASNGGWRKVYEYMMFMEIYLKLEIRLQMYDKYWTNIFEAGQWICQKKS